MLGTTRDDRGGRAGARLARRGAGRRRPGDGRRERRASCSRPAARSALIERILPRATVVTPNLAEARALAGAPGRRRRPVELARGGRSSSGRAAVIVTGGHGDGVDVLLEAGATAEPMPIAGELHAGGAAHGSGCTHSSTLAALLARGLRLAEAAAGARPRPGAPSATGCAGSARAPARSTCSGSASRTATRRLSSQMRRRTLVRLAIIGSREARPDEIWSR